MSMMSLAAVNALAALADARSLSWEHSK